MSLSWPQVKEPSALVAGVLALFLFGGTVPTHAQELGLKLTLPGQAAFSCPPFTPPTGLSEEERIEAGRLGSNANQALILGDLERARDLLARATELDPGNAELTYRYARALEDLGARTEAVEQFCRVLLIGAGIEGVGDAQDRLEALLRAEQDQIPFQAVESFEQGLAEANSGQPDRAINSFGSAWEIAPDLAEAVYNRGVLHARMGRGEAAMADLQRYLAIRPEAEDAIQVSQTIGQLQGLGNLPRPGSALGLGLIFPGAGQFYSGRAWAGVGVLTLTAGVAAAGFLIEEVTVKCVGTSSTGGQCPPDRVIGEEKDTPYLIHGLAAAGAVVVLGAVESFLRARTRRVREVGALVAMEIGEARLTGPSIHASGPQLHVSWVQVTF